MRSRARILTNRRAKAKRRSRVKRLSRRKRRGCFLYQAQWSLTLSDIPNPRTADIKIAVSNRMAALAAIPRLELIEIKTRCLAQRDHFLPVWREH
jgi:hypothetical protein